MNSGLIPTSSPSTASGDSASRSSRLRPAGSEEALRSGHSRKPAAAGIELLPRPEVGKPFQFALTATDGRASQSADLKGKVVLITCWASWSGPTTEPLPRLKTLYETHRAGGLEILGLNFDQNRAAAGGVVKTLALGWPQVYVPRGRPDTQTRKKAPACRVTRGCC